MLSLAKQADLSLKTTLRTEQSLRHLVRRAEAVSLRWERLLRRLWRSTLNATDNTAAEAKLRSLGYEWQWLPGDNLRVTTPVLPAVRTLDDGRRVFFNQLIAAFQGWQDKRNMAQKSISFGDGTVIDPQAMAKAIELAERLSYDMMWQAGDVALVDNSLVMHGRRPFQGERRVLASLVA